MSNPFTTPFIAVASIELGHWMLGIDAPLDFITIVEAFGNAGSELWNNLKAVFTPEPTNWENLGVFFRTIYLPYFVGSIVPGLIVSTLFYYVSIPLVRAYQKLRTNRQKERIEKHRRAEAEARRKAAVTEGQAPRDGDDETAGSL
jgi:uncharacterized protein